MQQQHHVLWLQLYDEMGSRHRVRPPLLNIIKTATVPDSHCKRDNTKQFHQQYDDKINKQVRVKFPMTRKMVRSVISGAAVSSDSSARARLDTSSKV